MKYILNIIFISVIVMPFSAYGQSEPKTIPQAMTLDDLLKKVQDGWNKQNTELKKREAQFLASKNKQKQLLKEAQSQLAALQKKSEQLEKQFDANEVNTAQLEETLRVRLGTMGELFGVIRQVAGDTRGQLAGSLISSQFPGREDIVAPLAHSKHLPSIDELEKLWFVMQQEMTESGKVVKYKANVVLSEGREIEKLVTRVGPFNAVADGKFLHWMPETMKLVELGRQPAARYLSTAADLENTKEGIVRMAIDPSRGSILSLLVQTPSFTERLQFGGVIGYIVIALGLITFLLACGRVVYLVLVGVKVRKQQHTKEINKDNPLGRIIAVYSEQDQDIDPESLELKLDEAIMKESGRLDRYLWAVKVVSVVAPLMGLLGTVTGMIRTFQAITLFGTGDPKLMASGISEALVTTMLGLMVAIPLVLIHSWLQSMSRSVLGVLQEESIGMVAKLAEEKGNAHEPSA